MSVEEYSEKEIEECIKKFKKFISIVVSSATIDFVRKVKGCNNIKEIALTELVDRNVSLSLYDSDTFFEFEEIEAENIENIITNKSLQKIIKNLTKDEKKILYLTAKDFSNTEIAKKMNFTEKTIRNKKSIIRAKIKAKMEDLKDENRYE